MKLLLCIAGMCCPWIAFTQLQSSYFYCETFGIERGLHHGAIADLQLDKNGLLWIHTIGAMQLFDGMTFVDMPQYAPDDATTGNFSYALYDDIFFIHGNIVQRLNTDDYTDQNKDFLQLPGHRSKTTRSMFLYENEHNIFVWHANDSLYQISKSNMSISAIFHLPVRPNQNMMFSDIGRHIQDTGRIAYLSEEYQLCEFDLRNRAMVRMRELTTIKSIAQISTDTFVTLDADYLHIYTRDEKINVTLPAKIQGFSGRFLIIDNQGNVLVALEKNIYEFSLASGTWSSIFEKAGAGELIDIMLRGMKQDRVGNIYFSTLNKGLVKMYAPNHGFDYIGLKDEEEKFVRTINGSDESNLVLMGTLQQGLFLFDTSGVLRKHYLDFPGGRKEPYISDIIRISSSRFLIIGSEAYELNCNIQNSTLSQVPGIDSTWLSYYDCQIDVLDNDKKYLNTHYGLLECSIEPEISFRFTPDHALHGSCAICPFNANYISSVDNILTIIDSALGNIRQQYLLPEYGFSRCITQYSETSVLLGTDIGLYHIDLSATTPSTKRIYNKMVYAILPGQAAHEFWFSTDFGLFKMKPDMQLTNYSKEAGLQENEFNTNVCYKSSSGKLYFGGVNGITAFYPHRVNEIIDNIIPYLSELTVNNTIIARYLLQKTTRKYTFSFKENNLGLKILGQGSRSPLSYNYQYAIIEQGGYWVDMGRNPNIYFHLSPGSYSIAYHVNDSFDEAASPQNVVRFTIESPFYRKWWFLLISIGVLCGLGLIFVRLNQKRRLLKREYDFQLAQRLQNERLRISRELHDNVGAQMATVKRNINFLVSNSSALSQEQITRKMLDLEDISTHINQELRDTIWAAQNEQISIADFITRLKNYVFQVLGPESNCRVHYEDTCEKEGILGPFLALNLHRICQETINNVMKHSGATEIRIKFEGQLKTFKVTIMDNGVGFDVEGIHEGYGLQNIRHRASQIGAILYFNRIAEYGSSLEISIPQLRISENSSDSWKM